MKSSMHFQSDNIVPFSNHESEIVSLPNIVVSTIESKRRVQELQTFVEEVMVKGVDYGLVDGFSKPTLLKPGAEKLCDVFGFLKTADVVNRIEQWESGIFAYEVKMTLIRKDNGLVEAEGLDHAIARNLLFSNKTLIQSSTPY
ncbi:hypothetical protein NST02_02285 [Robertmurraya sp. FSL W8-0741]|uniref:hypothetical protein n=1 Tax=Robertmurraya sp. FSL W8-0741 TaxID=2954629 RepID=UPI0030F8C9FF